MPDVQSHQGRELLTSLALDFVSKDLANALPGRVDIKGRHVSEVNVEQGCEGGRQ
jgi:hypothetical protein